MKVKNYTDMDFKNAPTWEQIKKRRKQQERRDNLLGFFFAIFLIFASSINFDGLEQKQTVKAEVAPVSEVAEVVSYPQESTPVVEVPKEEPKVIVAVEKPAAPKCDLSFQDVRVNRVLIITPPDWFVDMFNEYGIENCSKQRWMSQVAFYESEYCKGSLDNCSNVVGAANDSGLFQYIPSTWAAAWNPERGNSIFDGKAQFRATSLKYDLGGQGIWSTNKYTR